MRPGLAEAPGAVGTDSLAEVNMTFMGQNYPRLVAPIQ